MDEKHGPLQVSLRHSGYQLVYRFKLARTTENIWSYLTHETGLSVWISGCQDIDFNGQGEFCLPDGTLLEWCEQQEKELIGFKYKKKNWDLFSYVKIRLIPANDRLVVLQIMQENIPDIKTRNKLKATIEKAFSVEIFQQ